jgi:predicted house-cleaning noncanonical NTP pyrophosphatase (MazG superfamily)
MIKANASRHKALSWEYANRLEAQLKQEVEELMRLAEEANQCSRPEEIMASQTMLAPFPSHRVRRFPQFT